MTLTAGESCTFAELFPDAYELLPDPSGKEEYGGYAVTVTDKDGVLSIDEAAFPDVSENDTRLRDFKIGRINRKGSAQVAVSFGGKVYKATVKCK